MILSIIWLASTILLVAGVITLHRRNNAMYNKLVSIISHMDAGQCHHYNLKRVEVNEMLDILDGGRE